MIRWVPLSLAVLLCACGGGSGKAPVGTRGTYSLSVYWAANTRSFDVDGRSLRVTATRVDGVGTPVVAVFDRPANVDAPQVVTLPGEYSVGRHRLTFDLFDGLNGTGIRIGEGELERRLVPDSVNPVRVNIGLSSANPAWRVELPQARSIRPGETLTLLVSSATTVPPDFRDPEAGVNIGPPLDLVAQLSDGTRLEKVGPRTFRLTQPGFYTLSILSQGERVGGGVARVMNASQGFQSALAASAWPSSEGDEGRTRAVQGPGPRSLGTPTLIGAFNGGRISRAYMAVGLEGEVYTAFWAGQAKPSDGGSTYLFRFQPDGNRWTRSFYSLTDPLRQVALASNGTVVLELGPRVLSFSKETGDLRWVANSRRSSSSAPVFFFDRFVTGNGEFLDLETGERGRVGTGEAALVTPEGAVFTADEQLYDLASSSQTATLGYLNLSIYDQATGVAYSGRTGRTGGNELNLTTLGVRSLPGTSAVAALVPGGTEMVLRDLRTGTLGLYRRDTLALLRPLGSSGYLDVIAFNNRMIVARRPDGVEAIDIDTRERLWIFEGISLGLAAGIGTVYVAQDDDVRVFRIGS